MSNNQTIVSVVVRTNSKLHRRIEYLMEDGKRRISNPVCGFKGREASGFIRVKQTEIDTTPSERFCSKCFRNGVQEVPELTINN
jgi:hypothetical protein